eukprot:GSMAST32.ASY1.ANO1.186.1 assembled CDS
MARSPMGGRGSGRGRGRGRGGGRGRGRGGAGRGRGRSTGPPSSVVELGKFSHACEGELVFKSCNEKIPYFNSPIFLQGIQRVGTLSEIFGKLKEVFFSVKPADGVVASSWKAGDLCYIDPMKLLPLSRFTSPKKPAKGGGRSAKGAGGRGRGSGRGRGG